MIKYYKDGERYTAAMPAKETKKPTQLKRNQVTTAAALTVGDVFYKLKDKAKKPLQMVEHKTITTQYQTYNYWCAPNGNIKNIEAIKASTQVVFLRSLNGN